MFLYECRPVAWVRVALCVGEPPSQPRGNEALRTSSSMSTVWDPDGHPLALRANEPQQAFAGSEVASELAGGHKPIDLYCFVFISTCGPGL